MNGNYTILVADRNPHVRKFLEREMKSAGYEVLLAKNCQEVLKIVYQQRPLELLIMDPDLPGKEETVIWERLSARLPPIPVVIHGFSIDYCRGPEMPDGAVFVEKSGISIENIKKAAASILNG